MPDLDRRAILSPIASNFLKFRKKKLVAIEKMRAAVARELNQGIPDVIRQIVAEDFIIRDLLEHGTVRRAYDRDSMPNLEAVERAFWELGEHWDFVAEVNIRRIGDPDCHDSVIVTIKAI